MTRYVHIFLVEQCSVILSAGFGGR